MIKVFFLCLIISVSAVSAQWRNGDVIFSKTKGTQAIAVEAATESPWTHVAVIFIRNGKPMVLEAIQPVQIISLKSYLDRGGPKAVHCYKRLKDTSLIKGDGMSKATIWAKKHVGKDYDGRFQWSDNTLYCSELVWKVYSQCADIKLCRIRKVKEYNLQHPKVKKLIQDRFGSIKRLNLEEKVVAPSDIYNSELLVEFYPFKKKQTIEKQTIEKQSKSN